ncbi:hypothetical protein ABPG72_000839 [Tetrahymena utriculariae]
MIKGSGTVSFNKPLALVCYICGREYGTKSLGIHLKTCRQKWEVEEGKKPRSQRRPLPLPPAGLEELLAKPNISAADIQDFNTGAFNKYNTEALVKCSNCNRTFKPEALVHHQKACSKDNPFKPLGQPNSLGSQNEFSENDADNLKPCIFCNRKFAADRISKHESVCTKMDKSKLKTPIKSLGEIKAGTGGTIRSGGEGSGNSFGSPMKQPLRPKSLVCYICGREYGTKSLKIHLKTCEEKWHIEQNKLAKKDRRPIPQPPPGLTELLDKDEITFEDLERYNNRAFDSYNYSALMPCYHCGRTFKPEALVHHAKVCTAENPFKPLNRDQGGNDAQGGEYDETNAANLIPCAKCARKFAADRISKHELACKGTGGTGVSMAPGAKGAQTAPITKKQPVQSYEPKIPQRPKTLVCYICGREYGTTSLAIHLKTCEQKWHIEQEKLPKKDRRPLPKPPAQLEALLKGEISMDQMESYNNKAFDSYNTDALYPCKHCNRTFTQTALQHHSKVCTAEKPFKPLTRTAKNEQEQGGEDQGMQVPSKGYDLSRVPDMSGGDGEVELVPCDKCGRNFNADRITKHSKVCKGPTELKKKEPEPPKTDKPKKEGQWKKQHEEFVQSMKYMRQIKKIQEEGGDIRSLPPPPRSNTDHLVQCPYCNRKFAQETAEKHIPSCKNVINKPKGIAQSAPKTYQQMQSQLGSTDQQFGKPSGNTNIFASKSPQPAQGKIVGQTSQIRISQNKNIFSSKK